ncbi:nucleotidyltransferase family protein [Pseudomonas sp. TE3786]
MQHLLHLQTLLAADPMRMRVLRLVRELGLPDCWVAAGFVRSAVWDHLHQRRTATPLPDIDVIWYGALTQVDADLEASLNGLDSSFNWSVKNQARMHTRNADRPYTSATAAMAFWPETATAVAARLDAAGTIEVAAPYGLDDLFNLLVRPTAHFAGEKRPVFLERVRTKNWLSLWPQLTVCEIPLSDCAPAPHGC